MDSKVLRSITLLLTALFLTLGGGESHGTLSGVGTEIAQPAAVARMLQSTCSVPGLYMVPAGATPGWGPSSAAAVIGPVGYSQLVQGRTSNSSLASLANGTCPGAPNPSYSVGNASYSLGFILNFGVVPQPGWLLSLDTCQTSSPTASFTTLFLGSNCPTSWGAFKCFASNAQNACPNTAVTHLSRIVNVTLTAANALQYLYAFVTLPIATAPVYGGGTGVRVAWQLYIPATPSVTPSPSMSTSISASATPSPSRPAYCYGIEDFAVSMYGLAGAWNGSVIDPLLQWPIPDAFGPMWTFAPTADDPYYYAYTAPSYCTNDEVPVSDDGYGYPIAYSGVGPPAPFPMPPLPVVLVGIDLGDQVSGVAAACAFTVPRRRVRHTSQCTCEWWLCCRALPAYLPIHLYTVVHLTIPPSPPHSFSQTAVAAVAARSRAAVPAVAGAARRRRLSRRADAGQSRRAAASRSRSPTVGGNAAPDWRAPR